MRDSGHWHLAVNLNFVTRGLCKFSAMLPSSLGTVQAKCGYLSSCSIKMYSVELRLQDVSGHSSRTVYAIVGNPIVRPSCPRMQLKSARVGLLFERIVALCLQTHLSYANRNPAVR